MPRYRVTFLDGHSVVLEREHGDDAKKDARHERKQQTGATDRTDARVKVTSVERLAAAPPPPAPPAEAPTRMPPPPATTPTDTPPQQ
jgi:hypothetical protein